MSQCHRTFCMRHVSDLVRSYEKKGQQLRASRTHRSAPTQSALCSRLDGADVIDRSALFLERRVGFVRFLAFGVADFLFGRLLAVADARELGRRGEQQGRIDALA